MCIINIITYLKTTKEQKSIKFFRSIHKEIKYIEKYVERYK